MAPSEPGHSATVLVAFAIMGSRPIQSNVGNVRIVPPPAIEFIIPATTAAAKIATPCQIVTRSDYHKGIKQCSNRKSGRGLAEPRPLRLMIVARERYRRGDELFPDQVLITGEAIELFMHLAELRVGRLVYRVMRTHRPEL
jgi:hypothetical protein